MILNIENLTVYSKDKKLVHNININVKEKSKYSIIGETGSGKSIITQSIIKLKDNLSYEGKIIFNDQNILNCTDDEFCKIRGKEIGYIFQNPFKSLNPTKKIYNQIAEAILIHHKIEKKDLFEKIMKLIDIVGLKEIKNKLSSYPNQFSGGQLQRIAIAIAIANEPKLLIADEPTTALDERNEEIIINLFNKLNKELGITIILISHNINSVKKFADYICILKNGAIVEKNSLLNILKNPINDYTKLIINQKNIRLIGDKKPSKKPNIIIKNLNTWIISRNFLKNSKKYLLQNISFTIHESETLSIIGKSGSGKSTLAKSILGLNNSTFDSYILNNKEIQRLSKSDRRIIQIILQDPFDNLNPELTIVENIEEGMILHGYTERKTRNEIIKKFLKDINLDESILSKYPKKCSGGERQRICILRALVLNPKILVLDEITSALDIVTAQKILQIIVNIQEKYNISVIFISHDLNIVAQFSHKIIVLEDGKIIANDTTENILNKI